MMITLSIASNISVEITLRIASNISVGTDTSSLSCSNKTSQLCSLGNKK